MAQPVRSMALRSSARLQTAHRVTEALWSLTLHGRGAHLSWGSLPARKSSSDRPVCSYLDRAAMLSRPQQRLFFHFTAVLFIADFGLPPLAAFPRM